MDINICKTITKLAVTMNNRYLNILATASILAFATACEKDENLNEMGQIDKSLVPSITLSDVPTSFTMVEDDETIVIPVTLSKPWNMDSEVFIDMIEGTATLGDDIEVHSVRIENGDTEGELEIVIHGDDTPEETETAKFRITAGSNLELANAPEFTITLENYVSPDLSVNVSWAADFFDEDPTDLADFDVYIMDSEGEDVAGAETGAFENLDLEGSLPDGDYILYAYLYGASDLGDYGPVDLPLTATFSRPGSFSGLNLPQDSETVLTTENVEGIAYLAIITKADGIYTIKTYDEDPVIIGSGRVKPRVVPNKIWKKK
jgi:hypothetical protein